MRIVVLDSGISEHQRDILAIDIGYGIYDENGHGSKIVDIIRKVAYFAEILSIKILDKNNECNLEDLLRALEVCVEMNADVLCMSMTIEGNGNFINLKRLIDRISRKGTLIVSPLHNRKDYAIPAAFKHVVGVRAISPCTNERVFYSDKLKIQCHIPLSGIVCKTVGNTYDYFAGNSCACAFFSAELLCRLRTMALPSVSEVNKFYRRTNFDDTYIYRYLHHNIHSPEGDTFAIIRENVIKTLEKCSCQKQFVDYLYKDIADIAQLINCLSDAGLVINKSSFLRVVDLESIDKLTRYLYSQNPDFK